MPFSSASIHSPAPLVDFCVAYDPSEDGHLRAAFFPRMDVKHQTDLIRQVDTASVLRVYDLDVTGSSEVPEVEWAVGANLTYFAQGIAAKHRIEMASARDADEALQFDLRATKQAMISVAQRMEHKAVVKTLRDAAVITQNTALVAGSTSWDAYNSADSDPITDLKFAVSRIRTRVGVSSYGSKPGEPTKRGRIKIGMHEYSWQSISEHPRVLDSIKYQGLGAILTPELLAKMLRIAEEDIIITTAKYTTSKQGATATFGSFIGDDCIVALVGDEDDLNSQSLGREFVFDGLSSDGSEFLVRKWSEEGKGMHLQVPYVGVACCVDYKVTNANAAYLFQNVIDSSQTTKYPEL